MISLVTHFEIYGEEPAKLAEFYRSVFGWKIIGITDEMDLAPCKRLLDLSNELQG